MSLAAPEVVILITSGTPSDEVLVKIMIYLSQCLHDYQYAGWKSGQVRREIVVFICRCLLFFVTFLYTRNCTCIYTHNSHFEWMKEICEHITMHWQQGNAKVWANCSPSFMMTSSNGNIFGVTGTLWGESTGHRWIPLTKASDAELWCFLWSESEQMVEQTIGPPVIWNVIALIMMLL